MNNLDFEEYLNGELIIINEFSQLKTQSNMPIVGIYFNLGGPYLISEDMILDSKMNKSEIKTLKEFYDLIGSRWYEEEIIKERLIQLKDEIFHLFTICSKFFENDQFADKAACNVVEYLMDSLKVDKLCKAGNFAKCIMHGFIPEAQQNIESVITYLIKQTNMPIPKDLTLKLNELLSSCNISMFGNNKILDDISQIMIKYITDEIKCLDVNVADNNIDLFQILAQEKLISLTVDNELLYKEYLTHKCSKIYEFFFYQNEFAWRCLKNIKFKYKEFITQNNQEKPFMNLSGEDCLFKWEEALKFFVLLTKRVPCKSLCLEVCNFPELLFNGLCIQSLKSIKIVCSKFDNEFIMKFASCLKNASSLKELKIYSTSDTPLLNEEAINNLKIMFSSMKKLESLTLHFQYNQINEGNVMYWANTLKTIEQLKKLKLVMRAGNGRVEGDGLAELNRAIADSRLFTSLSLNIRSLCDEPDFSFFGTYNQLADKGLKELCQVFIHMKQLEKLHLDFSDNCITNKGIYILSDSLGGCLSLSKLSLSLENSDGEITDVSVQDLGKKLASLQKLSKINLNFRNTVGKVKITEKGKKSIESVFNNLNFSGGTKLLQISLQKTKNKKKKYILKQNKEPIKQGSYSM